MPEAEDEEVPGATDELVAALAGGAALSFEPDAVTGSVASLCQRVAILHEGEIVECASVEKVFRHPQHEYTRRLIAAIPQHPVVGHEPVGR